jgi:transposase InsO family protein
VALMHYGMLASMSRKGNCWDNAPTESFFNSLKNERTHAQRYATREEARQDTPFLQARSLEGDYCSIWCSDVVPVHKHPVPHLEQRRVILLDRLNCPIPQAHLDHPNVLVLLD